MPALRLRSLARWRAALCCGALLLCALSAAGAAVNSLRFTTLDRSKGLIDGSIISSLQDHRGLMWLGTANGLFRYDGRRFKHFAPDSDDEHALAHGVVGTLLEDDQDRLWIGTSAGLHRMDLRSETLQRMPMPADWAPLTRRVGAIVRDTRGRLWVSCRGGLLRYDMASGAYEQMELPADPDEARTGAMVADGQGGLFVARGARVVHLNAQGQQDLSLDLAQGQRGTARLPFALRTLMLDGQGRLWLGAHTGVYLYRWAEGRLQPDASLDALRLPQVPVHALRQDESQSIWIGYGAAAGLLRLRNAGDGQWRAERFTHHDAVPGSVVSSTIASLYQDASGVLWVGTWGSGLSLADLRSGGFTQYRHVVDEPDSLSGGSAFAVVPEGHHEAWVGSYSGGLNRLDLASGRAQRFDARQTGIAHVKALLREPDGRLWVGGDEGLSLFDPQRQRHERIALGNTTPGGMSIAALMKDRDGVLWIASGNGLYRREPGGRLQVFKASPNEVGALSHDSVDSLLQDRAGRIWIGTKGGLHLWDAQQQRFLQPIAPSSELKNPAQLGIFALLQDSQDRIWVGSTLGLYQLLPQGQGWRLESWRQLPGMARGWIDTMVEDQDGMLWLGSEAGLQRVDLAQRRVRLYPLGGGEFEGGFNYNAGARMPDGRLLFGTSTLLAFHPRELRDNRTPPRVLLSDLRVFNQSLLPGEAPQGLLPERSSAPTTLRALGIDGLLHQASALRLSHRESMVSFEFSALHFFDAQHNRYAWMLDGFDHDWIEGKPGEGVATYTNLDPGSYRLRVKASGPDGGWNEQALMLAIEVEPPFWRAWWFRAALLLGLVAGLAGLYRWRLRQQWQIQRRLEQEVSARTAEAVREKERAEREREQAEQARRDIALLSEIGRELAGLLDSAAILQLLYRHVQELMVADIFGVGLLRWDERVIAFDFCMQHGMAFEPYQRSFDATEQPAVQCALQARELIIERLTHDNRLLSAREGQQQRLRLVDGSEPPPARSAMYVPMLLKGQVMGVISVLSQQEHAYQGADLDKLRTLGAYAAVALDKAEAYRRLKLTQTQLVQQEKLAALGSLVAGVAHELNTPIGNSLLVASTLRDASQEFVEQARAGHLRRSDLERFCDNASASAGLLLRGLSQAAELVSSFKQLAVDQTSDQRRRFDLKQVCEELALTFASRLRREEHQLRVEIEAGIEMDSFPGPLGQVLGNLIVNALVHGLEGRKNGQLLLRAQRLGSERVQLLFSDDGKGIPPEHVGRIFEPFFTTKLGQGGSGLGLHISYNIISSLLGGSIRVQSAAGSGACFIIEVPLMAPQPGEAGGRSDQHWAEGTGV